MTAHPPALDQRRSLSEHIATWLRAQGVRWVFGVSGGGVAPLWSALCRAEGLSVVHCQHESGAAFCATEASLATGEPVVVFTTTGPGLTNALTGICAGREEGARILLLSGATPPSRRLRGATQECGPSTAMAHLYASGGLFDLAATVETASMLPAVFRAVEAELQSHLGCVAHIAVPTDLQESQLLWQPAPVQVAAVRPDRCAIVDCAERLRDRRVVIIAGFGVRHCSEQVQRLAETLEAPVVVTPRGKGVVPAGHPLNAGVLGFAGHASAREALTETPADIVLALGTSLGEGSSQYDPCLEMAELVFVGCPGAVGVQGRRIDVLPGAPNAVLDTLLELLPKGIPREATQALSRPTPRPTERVSPVTLMHAVQRVCVAHDGIRLMAESGNAFAFAIHELALPRPCLRVSVGWGSMAHFSCGVVGAALATGQRTVALVGDGTMAMQHELLTAVRHQARATWVVLNDGGYGMCRQGARLSGHQGVDCSLPPVDFAAWARALGVTATMVSSDADVDAALLTVLHTDGPSLLDVRIDQDVLAPISGRVRQLTWSGAAPGVHP